jgi:uncharacterized protein YrrD
MYCCKDFYSLSVLSLYEGELVGKVDKLFFDKKLKKLCMVGLVGEDGAKLFLSTKNIYRVGKNAITIKNNQSVSLSVNEQDFCVAPINSKAYSLMGEFLGVVQEISFDDKFNAQKAFLDNEKTIELKDLASCGKNAVVFNCKENKIKLSNFIPQEQPKKFKTNQVQKADTMPIEQRDTKNKNQVVDANFLIGRICLKDIFNFNNEMLVKANSSVTKKQLKEIIKFGKLKELMLYIK